VKPLRDQRRFIRATSQADKFKIFQFSVLKHPAILPVGCSRFFDYPSIIHATYRLAGAANGLSDQFAIRADNHLSPDILRHHSPDLIYVIGRKESQGLVMLPGLLSCLFTGGRVQEYSILSVPCIALR